MSVLVVGASHRTTPVSLLERLAVDAEGASKLALAALDTASVNEVVVLATCNRVEIYADVDRFHGSVEDLTTLLISESGAPADVLLPCVYVHYDEAAVRHIFTVSTGLDSLVLGEPQILGQVKDTLNRGQHDDTVGPALNSLFQQALRVGKRAHAETGIGEAGQSLVSLAVRAAARLTGGLTGARVCIVGAGSMATLAATSVRRAGVDGIDIASRNAVRARRLADRVGGSANSLDDLSACMSAADLVISCTGASGTVVTTAEVADACANRTTAAPLVLVDLALPHDIEPAVADLPGVHLLGMATLVESATQEVTKADIVAVSELVSGEVAAYAAARSAAAVTPTVIALRTMATAVVGSELNRLWARLGELSPDQRSEIATTVRRVADKLLHEPTVRIKELADQAPSASYADALAELFALDPATVQAVIGRGDPS
jgi:glutamyl-tRNA reductase